MHFSKPDIQPNWGSVPMLELWIMLMPQLGTLRAGTSPGPNWGSAFPGVNGSVTWPRFSFHASPQNLIIGLNNRCNLLVYQLKLSKVP